MRLAGIKKGGFYPLPPTMTEHIISAISKDDGENSKRILDPCAGKGDALVQLATELNLKPYGIELHEERALEMISQVAAMEGQDQIQAMSDSYMNLKAENGSFHVMYLNPPYDYDKESGRLEYTWLKKLNRYLGANGLLIWVIPEKVIKDRNVRRYLASWYTDLVIYRFAGESYETFKQIVVYGRRLARQQKADPQVQKNMKMLSELGENLPEHPMFEEPLYDLSTAEVSSKFYFYGMKPDPEAIKVEIQASGGRNNSDYKKMMSPQVRVKLDPLMPMKVGHMSAMISAGHINNEYIDATGGKVLIKGTVYNEEVVENTVEVGQKSTKYKKSTVFDPRAIITTIDEEGNIDRLQNSNLATFLNENLYTITDKLKQLYPPRYGFKVGKWGKYIKGVNPRVIPNTNRTGLLPAQKHAVAALMQQWVQHRDAILVGQLGTGKTVMAIAAAYALHQKNNNNTHFVVMCPPHLVKKWIREIGLTWPGTSAMALENITDVDRFFSLKGPAFGVFKSTTASAGAGWQHSIWCNGPMVLKQRPKPKVDPVEIVLGNEKVIEAHDAEEGDPDYLEKFKYMRTATIRCPDMSCMKPLMMQDPKNKKAEIPVTLNDFTNKKLYCEHCGSPLFQDGAFDKKPKTPLATYIKKKYKGVIDLAIVDEAHEYKGESSDRGYAYGRVVRASKRTLAMTGTIYGGKASTLFFLLFRLSPEFRKSWVAYDRNGRYRLRWRDWYKTYGVMEETVTVTEHHSSNTGGNTRPNRHIKEVAGSSPAMMPWLINRSVFVSLQDMGMALPGYKEEVIEVSMEGEMKEQYDKLHADLSAALAKRLIVGDRSLLSKYLNALIYYPDAAWRPKAVYVPNKAEPLTYVPGTEQPTGTHPKEKAIMEYIQGELKENRRCLLLIAQTATLDIQEDWKDLFARHNISSEILRVDPYGREKWIAKQEAKGTQVLISNPKKVATGLDILGYPTIIWMAPEFSIYTVMQASGRAFRLGQSNDCKVVHFAYTDTIQNQALRLVIAKSAAAKRVNGDTIDSDDLAHLDRLASNSIENALAKVLVQNAEESAKMIEIDLDYEKVADGLFDGYFADCENAEEAEVLYKELAEQYHPDLAEDRQEIESLATLLTKANADFKREASFIGGIDITDEDPEDCEDDFVVITETEIVEEEPEQEVVEVAIIPDPPEEKPVQKRLVFGQSTIVVKKLKKRKKEETASKVVQLSLF